MNPILEVNKVSKVYGKGDNKVMAVDSVSLSIKRRELLLIMGPSGSGKTTLLSMMGCMLHPTEGEVTVDGQMVSRLREDVLPDIRKKYLEFFSLNSPKTSASSLPLPLLSY